MTAETAHHPSGPLLLALSLAGIAGFIDAFLFLHVTGVFVANMSGNLVRVGIFTGAEKWSNAAGSAAALAAFTTGVIVAITHHDRRLRTYHRVRPDELLAAEALLTFTLPIILIVFDVHFAANADAIHYLVMGIGAFAMGMQASALRRVGDIAVATTYGTGTIVRIGEKAALALRSAARTSDHRRATTLAVLTGVLAAYVGGAAAASALGDSPTLLFGPPAVLTGLIVLVRREWRLRSSS